MNVSADAESRSRARRLPAEQRKEHFLDVAAAIILDTGFETLTMETVAERAGTSKGLGYAYFDNVEELTLAVYDREVAAVYRRVEEATASATSFDARLSKAISAYFDVVAERGVLLALLQSKLTGRRRQPGMRARLRKFIEFWSQQLHEEFRVARPIADAAAGAMLNVCDTFVRAWQAKRLTRREVEPLCTDFVIAGLHGSLGGDRRVRGEEPAESARRERRAPN
jgi:AcrR family transcriptional regulator